MTSGTMADRFQHQTYLVRRKALKLFGGSFSIYDPGGQLVLYGDMKAFKLKEDIRLYTDTSKQTEILSIKARQILDFSAAYDVVDSATNQKIGAFKRKGLKSIVQDEWIIMDANDNDIGLIREDSVALALVRRLLTNLVPQNFHAEIRGTPVCHLKQNFNPFILKLTVDFSPDTQQLFDRRLGIAAALLLCAIEGRQQ